MVDDGRALPGRRGAGSEAEGPERAGSSFLHFSKMHFSKMHFKDLAPAALGLRDGKEGGDGPAHESLAACKLLELPGPCM